MATDKPAGKNEPQSYGSGKEWVTGKTGEKVNEQKATPPPEHQDFYDSRHESDDSAPHQGGRTSPVQLAEHAALQAQTTSGGDNEHQPGTKVTTNAGGSKHDSFFRKRDYPD